MESHDALKNTADGEVPDMIERNASNDKSKNLSVEAAIKEHEDLSVKVATEDRDDLSGRDAPDENENFSGQGALEEANIEDKPGQSNYLPDVDLHEKNEKERTDLPTETVRASLPIEMTEADFEDNPFPLAEEGCNRMSTEGELSFEIQTPAVSDTVLEENITALSAQEMSHAGDIKLTDLDNPDQSFEDKSNFACLNLLENEIKNETPDVRSSADSTTKGSENSNQGETPTNAADASLDVPPISPDPVLDAFFSTGGPSETRQHGQFPALDFVDLETDEEGQQDLKRDEGGGGGGDDGSVGQAMHLLNSAHHQKEESAGDIKVAEGEEEKLKVNIKVQRFDEAPSDDSEDSSENFTPPTAQQQVFGNINNNNQDVPRGEINASNNADDKLSEDEDYRHPRSLNLHYAHPASERMQPSSFAYSSYESRNHNNYSYDPSESRSPVSKNSHFSERGSSYLDNRGHRLREENSHYRSVDSSLADSSTISSRRTHIERGDPRRDATRPESMTVPRFKTLQDQQVSWLEMFKMIEEQHKCDLHSQYMEHQRILQEMQRNMEKELVKQQETLKKRLSSHREILEELSPTKGPGRDVDEGHNLNQSSKFEDGDGPGDDRGFNDSSSHTTLMGIPVSLRNPAPLNRYLQRDFLDKRKEMPSTSRQADTSINLSKLSAGGGGGDKQLRGGVYSSPSPLAKVKHKSSPRGSKSYDDTRHTSPREDISHNSVHWVCDGAPVHRNASCDSSLCESDDVLSPRSRISLREKHAKHLADLKAYYEEELRELRQLLASRQDRAGGDGMTAGEKILSCENQELWQKCKELQDLLHDSRIEIRELQQKIQGLEIRSSDYAERFDTSQATVLSLKTRLEEVTEFAKEKEAMASEVELKHKKTIEALQMSFKKEKELSESLHNAKVTIQRLVDKYETLEKDYALLKETLSASEEKLFTTRTEAMDASSRLSKLELEVKQLKHDNEVLRHDRAIACSNQMMKTSYEDAYSPTSGLERSRSAYSSPVKARAKSADRSQFNNVSPESAADMEFIRSPILRAERELRNLQKSFSTQDFTPKLQKKFYGSEVTPRKSGLMSSVSASTNGHASPLDQHAKLSFHSRQGKAGNEPVVRTPPRGGSKEMHKGGSRESKIRSGQSAKKSYSQENGITGEQAVDRVKSGEIVSRPAWEDVYTSMAAPARQDSIIGKLASFNSTREMIIKERIQNIENLERRYDELGHEKIKYESALNRLPAQGHRSEKDKLESELDRVDRELGSVRMSLKRYHVLKSTI